jgi:hypothetical protein
MVTRDERGRKIEREKERDEKNEGKMMPGKGKERERSGPQLDKLDKPDKPPLTQRYVPGSSMGKYTGAGDTRCFGDYPELIFFCEWNRDPDGNVVRCS